MKSHVGKLIELDLKYNRLSSKKQVVISFNLSNSNIRLNKRRISLTKNTREILTDVFSQERGILTF
jgi:hypothetical protein